MVVDYKGVRYRKDKNRYLSHAGGGKWLHRVLWEERNSLIPKGSRVTPRDGRWWNFAANNWTCEPYLKSTTVHFKGRIFYKNTRGYYQASGGPGPVRLHRAIWEDQHGPIPDGYHIHHTNNNRDDNRLENLECMSAKDHFAHHAATSWITRSERARERRENAPLVAKTCVVCCEEYKSKHVSRYCSGKCRLRAFRQRKREL